MARRRTIARRHARGAMLLAAALLAAGVAAGAEPMRVYSLSARDGVFAPATIEVPAGTRFKIEIVNAGSGPIEFESRDLRQEKVLAAGARSSVVINGLKPGSYTFFDEFHPDTGKGRIVAK
ncbi:MAG TPA: cupredoxin domain-containing protein [Casimicrobiaceae bacterium]|nr:cupredoxin domain-containing protein [Casimicrobiaceae bacterium]